MGGDYYMAVTVKQIAELANVSRGTVDRVLNNRSGVSEATRQKVLKIAKELHYEPNFLAKALVSKKESLKIGVILTPDYNPLSMILFRESTVPSRNFLLLESK